MRRLSQVFSKTLRRKSNEDEVVRRSSAPDEDQQRPGGFEETQQDLGLLGGVIKSEEDPVHEEEKEREIHALQAQRMSFHMSEALRQKLLLEVNKDQ